MPQDRHNRFLAPQYGLVGREHDILQIETLLQAHNVLLLWGIGGTGKTSLLHHLRTWWPTTQFALDGFYFGYDQQAWTLEQMVGAIAQQLYRRLDFTRFQALPLTAQVRHLTQTLRAKPYVLMLDNLEVVTGQDLAIQQTLLPTDQAQVQAFLHQLVGGQTKVILSARGWEDWLDPIVGENHYELRGLVGEGRSHLAAKILEYHLGNQPQIEALHQDQDYQKLMQVLGGYPLAMEVILANLGHQSPREILAGVDAADVDLDLASADKTRSILRCIEYAYRVLSPAAQQLLIGLAPFRGFIFQKALPRYVEVLEKFGELAKYHFANLDHAVQDAIHWGILSPIGGENGSPFLVMQPVFPYILRTMLAQIKREDQGAVMSAFKQLYQQLAQSYQQLIESGDPEQQKLGLFLCKLEYENLYCALQSCLADHDPIDIFFCLVQYLKQIQDPDRELNLVDSVCQNLEDYPMSLRVGELGKQCDRAFDLRERCRMSISQSKPARSKRQCGLETYLQLKRVETGRNWRSRPTVYQKLGEVAQDFNGFNEPT